jgi:molecular chaperone GrpE
MNKKKNIEISQNNIDSREEKKPPDGNLSEDMKNKGSSGDKIMPDREIGIIPDETEDITGDEIIDITESMMGKDDEAEVSEEEKHLERMREENSKLVDQLLRLQAEFDNYRKRITRERQEMFKYKHEDFFRDFLPILDHFKRAFSMKALEAQDEESRTFYEGFRMIYENMLMILEKYDVRMMETVGKAFDPNYHDALAREESDEYPDNTIIAELTPGYTYKDRVLIHPKVKVAINKK